MPAAQPRRFALLILGVSLFLVFTYVFHSRSQTGDDVETSYRDVPIHEVDVSAATLQGDVIATKLGNETLKYVGAIDQPVPC